MISQSQILIYASYVSKKIYTTTANLYKTNVMSIPKIIQFTKELCHLVIFYYNTIMLHLFILEHNYVIIVTNL